MAEYYIQFTFLPHWKNSLFWKLCLLVSVVVVYEGWLELRAFFSDLTVIVVSHFLLCIAGAGLSGRQMHRTQGVFNHTEDYVLLPDERTISLCCWDSRTAERKNLLSLGHNNIVRCIVHSPTNPGFMTCSDDFRARFWYRRTTTDWDSTFLPCLSFSAMIATSYWEPDRMLGFAVMMTSPLFFSHLWPLLLGLRLWNRIFWGSSLAEIELSLLHLEGML